MSADRGRRNRRLASLLSAVAGAALATSVRAAEQVPLAGCYARVYDAADLAKHKGQIVDQVTLSVRAPQTLGRAEFRDIIADADLKIRVRGIRRSFDSLGVCSKSGEQLLCNGSLSAAEADQCKTDRDGIRQCRIDSNDAGSFRIEGKAAGVLVTIATRLELVQAPYDAGPFLYLSPGNAENHAFLLKTSKCK